MQRPRSRHAVLLFTLVISTAPVVAAQGVARPMTWLDVQNMQQIGAPAPSPDGRWVLYTMSAPDWKEARRQSDIYVVSAQQGVPSTRRLTFTADKSETNPAWTRDGQYFAFLSDRDGVPASATAAARASTLPATGPGAPYYPAAMGSAGGGAAFQLYLMRPDGGEARKFTDAKDGVSTFAFTRDGQWLVYRSGQPTQEQLYAVPVSAVIAGDSLHPVQLTRQSAGVGLWQIGRAHV